MTHKPVLILKNIRREGPGLLVQVLERRNRPYRILEIDELDGLPPIQAISALVVMGGPASANDDGPLMSRELAYVRKILRAGIPYLGICLGLQVLVKASGGKVPPSPMKEVGFRDSQGALFQVELISASATDPLFGDMEDRFTVFHLHGETVTLPLDSVLLGRGRWCENQVLRVGSAAWGLQGHIELTEDLLESWMEEDPDLQPMDAESLRRDFRRVRDDTRRFAFHLMDRFLDLSEENP